MTDQAAGVAGGGQLVAGGRVGSFELVQAAGAWGGQARFHARGAEGTPYAGVGVLVIARALAESDAATVEAMSARLHAIAALRHEHLAPVIEAGVSDGVAYIAQGIPTPETLAGVIGRTAPFDPASAAAIVDGLAAALDAAAAVGQVHGDVRLANIWLRPDGQPLLGGFALLPVSNRTPADDTTGLAGVLAALLAGRPLGAGELAAAWDTSLVLPDVIRVTVKRGLAATGATRHATAGAFAAALRQSLATAASTQVGGVWEAMERRDYQMAMMLCEAAQRLQPHDREITMLRDHVIAQMTAQPGHQPYMAMDFALPLAPPPPVSAPEVPMASDARVPPSPQEIAALLAGPAVPAAKGGASSAWLALATGMVILVALTLLATMMALSYR